MTEHTYAANLSTPTLVARLVEPGRLHGVVLWSSDLGGWTWSAIVSASQMLGAEMADLGGEELSSVCHPCSWLPISDRSLQVAKDTLTVKTVGSSRHII
jgi:hypothetical protein